MRQLAQKLGLAGTGTLPSESNIRYFAGSGSLAAATVGSKRNSAWRNTLTNRKSIKNGCVRSGTDLDEDCSSERAIVNGQIADGADERVSGNGANIELKEL